MKKTITLLAILYVVNVFATDRFVDPNLSQGNGSTLFTTISSAVAAAQNGDRIIIASSTYNEAELTINKSLQIIPQTAGTTINCNFNININGFPGMNLEIIGFNLGVYEFKTLNLTGGDYNNRAKVSIIDSTADRVLFHEDFFECILINNNVTKYIVFKHGTVLGNTTKHIVLIDELQDNNPNIEIKNKIIQNNVSFLIGVFNNDYPFIMANNTFRDLSIRRWSVADNAINEIINNTIKDNASFNFSNINVPKYNLIFSSNLFEGTFFHLFEAYGCGDTSGEYYSTTRFSNGGTYTQEQQNQLLYGFRYDTYDGAYNEWFSKAIRSWGDEINNPIRSSDGCTGWREQGAAENTFPKLTVPGFVEWTFNSLDFNCNIPDSSSPLTLTKNVGQTSPIDGGNPNHKYYDIDLTINDRGINGGPYSQLNYNASNPNNSRAFIFDLEMPVDLFPGQDVQIKAKGYHKN
mgnify:CR=1 FL=1